MSSSERRPTTGPGSGWNETRSWRKADSNCRSLLNEAISSGGRLCARRPASAKALSPSQNCRAAPVDAPRTGRYLHSALGATGEDAESVTRRYADIYNHLKTIGDVVVQRVPA